MKNEIQLLHGDCLERLKELKDNSVDSVVTDPPYGLSFMGKKWDYDVPSVEIWAECLRVLKPGGHLLAFAGTRTQHRMAVRIEDAGFEIRDMIAWVYGSGFPKSLDVSKAIDKAAGAEREVVGMGAAQCEFLSRGEPCRGHGDNNGRYGETIHTPETVPSTASAATWQGWGTALKPALEPITVARKPLVGTVAANVMEHGTGAINVNGCRVGTEKVVTTNGKGFNGSFLGGENNNGGAIHEGRWPANLIHDGSEEVVGLFPDLHGVVGARREGGDKSIFSGGGHQQTAKQKIVGGAKDSGSAARFFYCAKASKRDRDEGLEGFQAKSKRGPMTDSNWSGNERFDGAALPTARNHHPTVKPTALMRYLCRLVTPPGGTVLDPFMGSGSTGKAAVMEGFNFIGIEREADYMKIAKARIEAAKTLI